MQSPAQKPVVYLLGQDGNALVIMGKVRDALRQAGFDKQYIYQYISEAKSGDYNNLLAVTMKYADIR
ncbi:MAG: hypothetical protein AB7U45_16485 [Desulfamplus sp.]